MRARIPLLLLLFCARHVMYSQQPGFQFLSPRPRSLLNRRQTSISIRKGPRLAELTAQSLSAVHVTGTASGDHAVAVSLSDDRRTLLLRPAQPFTSAETVTVRLDSGMKTERGDDIGALQYTFDVGPAEIPSPAFSVTELGGAAALKTGKEEMRAPRLSGTSNNTLPPSFPAITEIVNTVQPQWNIYLANIAFVGSIVSYNMVINTDAVPLYYNPVRLLSLDFKWQPTGRMTYYDTQIGGFVVLDSAYAPMDTVFCQNGYTTDVHDIRMLPNGNTFLMSYDPEEVDMAAVVPGGKPNAVVTGLVIQEIDQHNNVIFQWRSWDHFNLTDALGVDLTAQTIDAVHGNAIEVDSDTSIVISSRFLSELTKIDLRTGDIIWRWGGKHNQFTFVNDTVGFSYQHAIRKIANGHFTLFDNGNLHNPPYSRAAEYALDEQGMTATLVWSFRHNPDVYSSAMGYVQRLDDGSTLVGWGAANPTVTLLGPQNSTLLEMSFPDGIYSYRAYAYPVEGTTAVMPVGGQLPQSTDLLQNFPNPFNPTTQISYTLAQPGPVKLVVYDLLGRAVGTVVNGIQSAGSHTVLFDASRLASGAYFYRLTSGTATLSKKMLLVR